MTALQKKFWLISRFHEWEVARDNQAYWHRSTYLSSGAKLYIATEDIDELAFALVAPLRPQDDGSHCNKLVMCRRLYGPILSLASRNELGNKRVLVSCPKCRFAIARNSTAPIYRRGVDFFFLFFSLRPLWRGRWRNWRINVPAIRAGGPL